MNMREMFETTAYDYQAYRDEVWKLVGDEGAAKADVIAQRAAELSYGQHHIESLVLGMWIGSGEAKADVTIVLIKCVTMMACALIDNAAARRVFGDPEE
jgi:hypothetical protein